MLRVPAANILPPQQVNSQFLHRSRRRSAQHEPEPRGAGEPREWADEQRQPAAERRLEGQVKTQERY